MNPLGTARFDPSVPFPKSRERWRNRNELGQNGFFPRIEGAHRGNPDWPRSPVHDSKSHHVEKLKRKNPGYGQKQRINRSEEEDQPHPFQEGDHSDLPRSASSISHQDFIKSSG